MNKIQCILFCYIIHRKAIKIVEDAVSSILSSKDYQNFTATLTELTKKVKADVQNILKNEPAADIPTRRTLPLASIAHASPKKFDNESNSNEEANSSFEQEINGIGEMGTKIMTVEELSKFEESLRNPVSQEKAIEELSHISPLDIVWHEKFSKIAESLFAFLLAKDDPSFTELSNQVVTFLNGLMDACKTSVPQKALEIYDHWLKCLNIKLKKGMQKDWALIAMALKIVTKESNILVENEFLFQDSIIHNTVFWFFESLSQCTNCIERFSECDSIIIEIEEIIQSEMIAFWMKKPIIRQNVLQYFQNAKDKENSFTSPSMILNSSKVLCSCNENKKARAFLANLLIAISIQLQCAIHKGIIDPELIWKALLESMDLLIKRISEKDKELEFFQAGFDEICQCAMALVRYSLIKCNAGDVRKCTSLIKNFNGIYNIKVKSWLMNISSIVVAKVEETVDASGLLECISLTYKTIPQSDSEYYSCFLSLFESVTFCLANSQHSSQIWHTTLSAIAEQLMRNPQSMISNLLMNISSLLCVRNWLSGSHYMTSIFNCISTTINKRELILCWEIENTFSSLLLKKEFNICLFEARYIEKTIETYFESILLEQPNKKAKQILHLILTSPICLFTYKLWNARSLNDLLDSLLDYQKCFNDDILNAGLALLSIAIQNPINEFLFRECNLGEKLQNTLGKIQIENIETENTKLIKEILSFQYIIIPSNLITIEIKEHTLENCLNCIGDSCNLEASKEIMQALIIHFESNKNKKIAEIMKNCGDLSDTNNASTWNDFKNLVKKITSEYWVAALMQFLSIPNQMKSSQPYFQSIISSDSTGIELLFNKMDTVALENLCDKISMKITLKNPKINNLLRINCLPLSSVLFTMYYTKMMGILQIHEAFLWNVALLLSNDKFEDNLASLSLLAIEGRLKDYEIIGRKKTYRKLFLESKEKIGKLTQACIDIIKEANKSKQVITLDK